MPGLGTTLYTWNGKEVIGKEIRKISYYFVNVIFFLKNETSKGRKNVENWSFIYKDNIFSTPIVLSETSFRLFKFFNMSLSILLIFNLEVESSKHFIRDIFYSEFRKQLKRKLDSLVSLSINSMSKFIWGATSSFHYEINYCTTTSLQIG